MGSAKIKTLVIVSVLLLSVGFITVGCKKKTVNPWVNTSSMPGNTFAQHTSSPSNNNRATVVYLGSDNASPSQSSGGSFGPKDVNFEFKNLK